MQRAPAASGAASPPTRLQEGGPIWLAWLVVALFLVGFTIWVAREVRSL